MKTTLSREHRKILETTVAQARAEAGAEKALKALAVGTPSAAQLTANWFWCIVISMIIMVK